MFYNYFKTAFRNLLRNKGYAAINVVGLAIGIAACLLIFLIIEFETSFDDFHKKKSQIFRVGTELVTRGGVTYDPGSSFPVGPQLRLDFPQIEQVASIFNQGGQITIDMAKGEQKKFKEDNFYYAEPEFFKMFDFELLDGDPSTCLRDPNSAMLTEATAQKYFDDWKTAIGKTIKYQNKTSFKICGILKNIPRNSDFPLSIVVPYSAIRKTYLSNNLNDWKSTFSDAYTFVVLPKGFSQNKFNAELKVFAKKYRSANNTADGLYAQPLREIHFDSRFGNYGGHTFSHSLVDALALIGIFLILIASVNFINLATAQAVNRSKEVGIRKVLGGIRRQLAVQFLAETFIVTLGATATAVGIAIIILPLLNQLLEVNIIMNFISQPALLLFLALVVVAVTFLSGIYPALVLSGFSPIIALKSKVSVKMTGGIFLRRGLVVLQFAIAQILIIGMLMNTFIRERWDHQAVQNGILC